MVTEQTEDPKDWHYENPIPETPEIVRADFNELLQHRVINYDIYRAIPPDLWDHFVGNKGDSPRKEIIHQIRHTQAHGKALLTGELLPSDQWKIPKGTWFPPFQDHEELSRFDLLAMFKSGLFDVHSILTLPDTDYVYRLVRKPWGAPVTGAQLIQNMMKHEIYHTGINMQFINALDLPRPQSLRNRWG